MKIAEKKGGLEIIPLNIVCDSNLTYFDKKTKTLKDPDWLNETPLWKNNHILVYVGLRGSGKTSTCLSLLTSQGKGKAYKGLYDHIIVCMPSPSINSLAENPFEKIPKEQIFHEFNEELLDYVIETCESNCEQGLDQFLLIDDASSKLRATGTLTRKLEYIIMNSRHYRLTIHILIQEFVFLSPSVLSNVSGLFIYRITQRTRAKEIRERFLSFLNDEKFTELERMVHQKKGDFLFIKMADPIEYYRKFDQILF